MNFHKRSLRFSRPFYALESISLSRNKKKKEREKERGRKNREGRENKRGGEEMIQKGHGQFARSVAESEKPSFFHEKIFSFFPWRINDCLRRVIRRHQTSRSSSGIVYLARSPPGCAASWVARGPPPPFVTTIMLI